MKIFFLLVQSKLDENVDIFIKPNDHYGKWLTCQHEDDFKDAFWCKI